MGSAKRERIRLRRQGFTETAQEVLTRNFQNEIRNSEMWPKMIEEFGEKKAEELLKECKGEIRPVFSPDENRNNPADI